MQLTARPSRAPARRLRTAAIAATALACAGATVAAADPLRLVGHDGESLFRWFSDSDRVSVRSVMGDYTLPLRGDLALALHVNHERVTIPAIDAAPGTAEAVDAITTASRPIAGNAFQDFLKVRNEVEGALERGPASVRYYVSSEPDYLAQQMAATVARDVMDEQLNLSFGASVGWDSIEPLADDDNATAAGRKTTVHVNTVATRILSPTTLMRVGVELNQVSGLQHNPYRNVFAGGGIVAERHPDQRQRRDAFVKLNQYLSNRSSLKLGYRFYHDDWGIASHEVTPSLSQYVTHGAFVQYQYRWYTQTAADFHREAYASPDGVGGHRTGDYRMGPLSSHLFGVAFQVDLRELAPGVPLLGHTGWRVDVQRYFNSNSYSANIIETGLDVRF